ncbi:MAG: OmpA family protein [Candidatus Abyssobacteria bacterium SURF_17]|jgi:outer membrane protein OmpA-like peptidoglycan-associated protein|uniref:OmpA family protein n=1 Tax=Candidatus Abyssobacteria bacterium SURF_17 TaxID=2093361 RepID=A0A419EUE4_9BACT|nr:MAG: OmpA family protein [Candidatus Abyssubacteria bacterium SURF_17]
MIRVSLLIFSLVLLTTAAVAEQVDCDASVVDVATTEARTDGSDSPDIYIVLEKPIDVHSADTVKIYRPIVVKEASGATHRLQLYVGRLRIIDVQPEAVIGRMIELASGQEHPRVRYKTVMIGDCLVMKHAPQRAAAPPEALTAGVPQAPAPEMPTAAEALAESRALPTRILFAFDSARIEKEWREALDMMAAFIVAEKPARVVVHGHACAMGPEAYNLKLSRRRAQAVVDYFVNQHGIDKAVFEVIPHGETDPEVSNETEEGRRKNRRAAMSVLVEVVPYVEVVAEEPAESKPAVESEEAPLKDTDEAAPSIPAEPLTPDAPDIPAAEGTTQEPSS